MQKSKKSIFTFSILLHHNFKADCVDEFGYTPLFYACKVGSLENIYELCYHGADVNFRSTITEETPIFKSKSQDVVMVLLKLGADPNYIASSKILQNGKMDENPDVLEGEKSMRPLSVIEHFVETNSNCAKAILNNCLSKEKNDNLILDFEVFKSKGDITEVSLVSRAIEKGRQDLILHPIMEIFSYIRYDSIRYQFYCQLVFQLLCVVCFTSLGVDYVNLQRCEKQSFTLLNYTNCFKTTNDIMMCGINSTHSEILNTSLVLPISCVKQSLRHMDHDLIPPTCIEEICIATNQDIFECWTKKCIFPAVLIIIMISREIHEMFAVKKLNNYLQQQENFVQLVILITSIGFIVISHFNVYLAEHFAAWMVFFSWIDLTLLFGQMDKLGEYIYMSIDVLQTMAICIIIYIPSFLAFSFGFYILLNATESFNSYVQSMVKVLAMSVGELDYTENFDYNNVKEHGGMNISAQVMVVTFIITMALIMMNILLAVTIDRTEDLEPKSRVRQAKRRENEIMVATRLRKMGLYKIILRSLKIGKPIFKNDSSNYKV